MMTFSVGSYSAALFESTPGEDKSANKGAERSFVVRGERGGRFLPDQALGARRSFSETSHFNFFHLFGTIMICPPLSPFPT